MRAYSCTKVLHCEVVQVRDSVLLHQGVTLWSGPSTWYSCTKVLHCEVIQVRESVLLHQGVTLWSGPSTWERTLAPRCYIVKWSKHMRAYSCTKVLHFLNISIFCSCMSKYVRAYSPAWNRTYDLKKTLVRICLLHFPPSNLAANFTQKYLSLWVKYRLGVKPNKQHIFSWTCILFLERYNVSPKVHTTDIKTIGDNCTPHAVLLWLVRKTGSSCESFRDARHFGDVKMKLGKKAYNAVISSRNQS